MNEIQHMTLLLTDEQRQFAVNAQGQYAAVIEQLVAQRDQRQWCERMEAEGKLRDEIHALSRLLCRLCALAGDDPKNIEQLVWYKQDGWEHGGSAMTWRDRVEELEEEARDRSEDPST